MTDAPLDLLAQQAKSGDTLALEEVVRRVQDQVYGLALRMLSDPVDAQDATQDALIKIVTNLATFRGESAFTTWVYRVASNHLLTTRKRRAEQVSLSFEGLAELLDQGLAFAAAPGSSTPDDHLLEEEIKIGCTQSMLLCLDRDHRIAFILGEILDVTSEEAAYILSITPETFRKRLSRARVRIRAFMGQRCGLVNPDSPCRCSRQAPFAIQAGLLDPNRLRFATHPVQASFEDEARAGVREIEALERSTAVFRSHPAYAAPARFSGLVRDLISSGKFQVLGD